MLAGLCLLLAAGPALAADWTEEIPRFAPALRGCLAPEAGAYADAAWTVGQGKLGVRLRRRNATAYCIARLEGGEVVLQVPLPQAPPPDPTAPAFFLERRCAEARRIDGPDGTALGWLAHPAC